jgi:hypothetical protein
VKQQHDHHHRGRRGGRQDRPQQRRAGPPVAASRAKRRPGRDRRPRRAAARSRLERGTGRRLVTRARVRHRRLLVPGGLVRLRRLDVRLVHRRLVRLRRLDVGLVHRRRARELLIRRHRTGRRLERAARFGGAVPIAPLVPRCGVRPGNRHRARQADLGVPRPARLRWCWCWCWCWCLRDARSGARSGSIGRRELVDDALPALGTEPRTRAQPRPAFAAPAARLCHCTTAHPGDPLNSE